MDRGLINFVGADLELTLGNTAPAQYALSGQRHMHEFGTTPEDFAAVAVKSRLHGALNPNARIREKVTLDEVLSSRPIAEPLTLLQCCRNGSGAAAVVIGSDRALPPPLRTKGMDRRLRPARLDGGRQCARPHLVRRDRGRGAGRLRIRAASALATSTSSSCTMPSPSAS